MRNTIAIALSLFLLTTALTGCGRRGNVSEDVNGKITEPTKNTEIVKPTTQAPTESTTVPIMTETEFLTTTADRETDDSIGTTTDSMDEADSTSATSETHTGSTEPGNGGRSRRHSGIMEGNDRY